MNNTKGSRLVLSQFSELKALMGDVVKSASDESKKLDSLSMKLDASDCTPNKVKLAPLIFPTKS